MAEHITTRLRDNQYLGQECFIIGSGPSLAGFNFDRLRGRFVITCNREFEFVPWSEINVAMDIGFYHWIHDDRIPFYLRHGFACYTGVKVWLELVRGYPFRDGIHTVRALGEMGLSTSLNQGLFHGRNTGYTALQLALVLGCSPIYLLGFDMGYGGDQVRHYASNKVPADEIYRDFVPPFNIVAEKLGGLGQFARVWNLSQQSALHCFPFASVDQILPPEVSA
jgi:hypothetical protein